jgi:hypothetical protein
MLSPWIRPDIVINHGCTRRPRKKVWIDRSLVQFLATSWKTAGVKHEREDMWTRT